MNLLVLKRTLAVLGVVGGSALMTLPVLAQTNSSVLNPNPSIFNEAPYNRGLTTEGSTAQSGTGATSDRCAAYFNGSENSGGVGGPIDNSGPVYQGSYAPQAPSTIDPNTPYVDNSSDGVAAQGVFGATDSFDRNNYVRYNRNNNTSFNSSSNGNYNGVGGSYDSSSTGAANEPYRAYSSDSPASSNLGSRPIESDAQFSANNPQPGVAYRENGPAGTNGREASAQIDAATGADHSNSSLNTSSNGNFNNNANAGYNNSGVPGVSSNIPAECLR